jgi:D-glycero-alpha-D-manno-heptose-7-phosphate kinase
MHITTRAPVRISFGGGGTDLPAYYLEHSGFVVSAAITRYCYAIAREPADRTIRLNSADYRLWERYAPDQLPPVTEPLVLPKAAIEHFANQGLRARGLDLFLAAEVPPGTGLGSSSAMAVALVHTLAAYTGKPIDASAAANLASWLEIERLGMPIGRQDQYASAYGGLNTIEFAADGVRVQPLPISADVRAALAARLLLFSTGQSRHSSAILGQQRDDSKHNALVIESLHRLKALAHEMAAALVAGELDAFGHLLHQGWQEKKGLSKRLSNPAIDEWYTAAREAGALGGKITGAGGGGFLLLYCPPQHQSAVRERLTSMGLQELPFDFDLQGATVIGNW